MSNKKLCEITDIVPVKVFPDLPKKMGPIKPMWMESSLIFSILNTPSAPKHFYALDPNNHMRKVLLTRANYNKTTEELFGETRRDAFAELRSRVETSSTVVEPDKSEEVTAEEQVIVDNSVEDDHPNYVSNESTDNETTAIDTETEIEGDNEQLDTPADEVASSTTEEVATNANDVSEDNTNEVSIDVTNGDNAEKVTNNDGYNNPSNHNNNYYNKKKKNRK